MSFTKKMWWFKDQYFAGKYSPAELFGTVSLIAWPIILIILL
jgi:hypothetical protein